MTQRWRIRPAPRRVDSLSRSDLETLPPSVRPLTLDAALERHGQSARLLIELKEPQPSSEGLVLDAIERHGMADRVALQVSDLPALHRLRLRTPSLALASLHRRKPSPRTLDCVARCAGTINIWHLRVDAGLVAAAHSRGLAVGAWTVNSPAAIDHMLAVGVDGVITDVPDIALARTLLKRERPTATNLNALATAV